MPDFAELLQRALRSNRAKQVQALIARYGLQRHGHAIFAPSSAAMWANCSGSLLLEKPDDAGIDAAMGTVAHAVMEEWNKSGKEPRHLIGTVREAEAGGTIYKFTIDELMLSHLSTYRDWIMEVPGRHYYEQWVSLDPIMPIPKQGGTADHFACSPGLLVITDLKYGMVRVYAENNLQAICYALGVFYRYDKVYHFERIIIRIGMPRQDIWDTWEISREELLAKAEWLKERADLAWTPDAPRTPGPDQCKYCPGKRDCPARLKELDELIDDTFNDLDEDEREVPLTLDAEQLRQVEPLSLAFHMKDLETALESRVRPLSTGALAYTLARRKHVETFFKGIYEELLRRADAGEKIPYFKMGPGRSSHAWKDERSAIDELDLTYGVTEEDLKPRVMMSPNKAYELLRAKYGKGRRPKELREAINRLTNVHSGKQSLIPLKDDREDVYDSLDEIFYVETEDDDDL